MEAPDQNRQLAKNPCLRGPSTYGHYKRAIVAADSDLVVMDPQTWAMTELVATVRRWV